MGNRVWRQTSDGVKTKIRKFIVDINSQLSVVLGEIEADASSPDYGSLKKSYHYADAQILSMVNHGPVQDARYFYVHASA